MGRPLNARLLRQNILINLLGYGFPIVSALLSIPFLVEKLGVDRFGILNLAWVVVGYFSLFDLGLGRALTKMVSERLDSDINDQIPGLIWTSIIMMSVLGVFASVLLAFLTPLLVESTLRIPLILQDETRLTLYVLAASIPVVIVTTGLYGVFEAYQRFGLLSMIRIPLGVFTFAGPLAVTWFTNSLVAIVGALVSARIVTLIICLILCFRVVPVLKGNAGVATNIIKPLLSYGGWLTVSNIIGPIMLYADRFFIASMLSVTAVTYYTMPFEVISKILIIPSAILGVMFPAFSRLWSLELLRLRNLYHHTMVYTFLAMFPLVLLVIIFSEKGLALWLNAKLAHESYQVAQLLGVGVLLNSCGLISQALIQAAGRPDITAKLHLIELPIYLGYLSLLLLEYGVNGAAGAWLIRVTISAVALAFIANRMLLKKRMTANQGVI